MHHTWLDNDYISYWSVMSSFIINLILACLTKCIDHVKKNRQTSVLIWFSLTVMEKKTLIIWWGIVGVSCVSDISETQSAHMLKAFSIALLCTFKNMINLMAAPFVYIYLFSCQCGDEASLPLVKWRKVVKFV